MTRKRIVAILTFFITFYIPFISYCQDEQAIDIIIQKDDCLIKIAEKYLENPTKWRELARINSLHNPDLIYPGQTLRIPIKLLKGKQTDGVVSFIKGSVLYQPPNSTEWKMLFLNDHIKEGYRIKTGDQSRIEITFQDNHSLLQDSNTTLELFTSREKANFYTYQKLFLLTGKTITKIKKATGRESRFQIDSPSAICAVRGTTFRTSVDENNITRAEVLQGNVNVEAMNQVVTVEEGEGTLVRKGEKPLVPQKLLPPPALIKVEPIYKNFPIVLSFTNIENAVSYRVIFSQDKDIKNIVYERVIKPHETFEIYPVEDGTYYLETRSIDNLGIEGLSSQAIPIKIRINPVPPFLEIPADQTVYRKKSILLKWLGVNDAVKYHIQISEDREFNIIFDESKDIKDTVYKTKNLDYKTYYFRISSIADDGYQGAWSNILSFTIQPAPPVEVPEIVDKKINITWLDLGVNMKYRFQLSTDKEFKDILINQLVEKSEIKIQKPKKSGTYFVRVSPIDPMGSEGDFSEPQMFEIKKSPFYKLLGILGTLGFLFFLTF
ncbi:MAG: FecR domain-containing protein [Nitrospirae bacterium]|nr:FecR domain-containing protein [Nitrospirota bacterium]